MLLAGQQIWLLASGGTENVATLGDVVTAGCADAEIVGGPHQMPPSSAASAWHEYLLTLHHMVLAS